MLLIINIKLSIKSNLNNLVKDGIKTICKSNDKRHIDEKEWTFILCLLCDRLSAMYFLMEPSKPLMILAVSSIFFFFLQLNHLGLTQFATYLSLCS